jgi:hypothetical protein
MVFFPLARIAILVISPRMVALSTLKYLASQKLKDASILFKNGRNAGAIYLMGYALEFTLKRKISLTLNFANGFPESNTELNTYATQIATFNSISAGTQLTHIKQIRNHDLQQLLTFSGAEARIIPFLYDWEIVKSWHPEKRYLRLRFTKEKTKQFIHSARTILNQI